MKTCFAAFIPDGTTWAVLFADLELATQGDTLDSAFLHAQDALRGRMQAMTWQHRMISSPTSFRRIIMV